MINEFLIILSLPLIFGTVLVSFILLKKYGLYAMTVITTISANIEVMILVDAFGIKQTLGNVMFASTFLITDILSECYSKKEADNAVNLGIFTSVVFILFSASWMHFLPSEGDTVLASVQNVFSNTPRMMLSSIAVYSVCQKLDVFLYHKIWALTARKSGSKKAYMWVRNNLATLISQFINTVLFNFAAFWGTFALSTIVSIIVSGFIIYILTSLLDTPFLYVARKIYDKQSEKDLINT